jgi:hypothetical protein
MGSLYRFTKTGQEPIIVDTFRHAALGAYGKNLASSPFFSLKSTVEVSSLSQLKPTSQTAPAKEDPAFTVAALQRNVLGFLFTPPLTFV